MSTDNGNSTHWIEEEIYFSRFSNKERINPKPLWNCQVWPQRAEPMAPCSTVRVGGILLWQQKRLSETSQTIWMTHMIWLLVYGLTSTVTVFTGSMKKGYKHMTEGKLARGSWTNNLLHSILAQAQQLLQVFSNTF